MIGVGLGLTLNHRFLADTAIERQTGIVTNEYLETNLPGVYSAGDVAEFYDAVLGQHHTWAPGTTRWPTGARGGQHGRRARAVLGRAHLYQPALRHQHRGHGHRRTNNPELDSDLAHGARRQGQRGLPQILLPRESAGRRRLHRQPQGRRKVLEIIRSGQEFATPAERDTLFDVR